MSSERRPARGGGAGARVGDAFSAQQRPAHENMLRGIRRHPTAHNGNRYATLVLVPTAFWGPVHDAAPFSPIEPAVPTQFSRA